MSPLFIVVIIFVILAGGLGLAAFLSYRRVLRRAKAVERGLKMVPVLIHLPPPSSDTAIGSREVRDVMREKTAQAEVLYNLIAGTAQSGFKSNFYGQRHIALEIVASQGVVHFYAAVPVGLVAVIEQAIQTAYPGAKLEEVEDHNVFSKAGRLTATLGGEITTKFEAAFPIATFKTLERDPLEAMLNTFSGLKSGDGAAVQVMVRPANPNWVKRSAVLVKQKMKGATASVSQTFTPVGIAQAMVKAPDRDSKAKPPVELSGLERSTIEAIEDKAKYVGFEVLIRVVVSTDSVSHSQQVLQELANAFALFEAPGLNGFKFMASPNPQALVDAFIFRFFPPQVNWMVLNSVELATLFHLPDAQFTPSSSVSRQASKEVDGPSALPATGLLFGYNEFRGKRSEIRLSDEDRRRHTYIIGQTGTGKSTMLENLIVQDMLAGRGFAFIDPHGDTADKLLGLVPKSRAEDVIYFNPADTEFPLGLNLFEFSEPEQKDFLIQETLNMLYKLYDANGTGVIGPRFEQWFRNAALTLMSDPAGSTFIEIPKVFTDTDYLKAKFKYLTDPTVIEFWTKEMGQTSDYHKSEMLGYFVSKFGAFQQNEMMRNIIGQTKSSFDLREIMDQKKILLVNLSKGKVGELNSKLLGMMFVIKFQAAAMSRANIPEADRSDFSLYVDEFQNFATDSFASILSEARKYRLNLIVANQFVGQLMPEIRDAVFGNVGTIISHRVGPEDAEFMTKQFAPVFEARDLVNIPNFHAVIRLMVGGLPSQPFSMTDLPLVAGSSIELGNAIKQLAAAKYGHPKDIVEADIARRLSGAPVTPLERPEVPAPPAPAPEPARPPQQIEAPAPVTGTAPGGDAVGVAGPPTTSQPTSLAVAQGNVTTLGFADIARVGGATAVTPASAPAPVAAATKMQTESDQGKSSSTVASPNIVHTEQVTNPKPIAADVSQPATSSIPAKTYQPAINVIATQAQNEIDELLEAGHIAKPVRHRLSESAPELIKGNAASASDKHDLEQATSKTSLQSNTGGVVAAPLEIAASSLLAEVPKPPVEQLLQKQSDETNVREGYAAITTALKEEDTTVSVAALDDITESDTTVVDPTAGTSDSPPEETLLISQITDSSRTRAPAGDLRSANTILNDVTPEIMAELPIPEATTNDPVSDTVPERPTNPVQASADEAIATTQLTESGHSDDEAQPAAPAQVNDSSASINAPHTDDYHSESTPVVDPAVTEVSIEKPTTEISSTMSPAEADTTASSSTETKSDNSELSIAEIQLPPTTPIPSEAPADSPKLDSAETSVNVRIEQQASQVASESSSQPANATGTATPPPILDLPKPISSVEVPLVQPSTAMALVNEQKTSAAIEAAQNFSGISQPHVSSAHIPVPADVAATLSELTGAKVGEAELTPTAAAAKPERVIPALAPGEIYVDEDGKVHQG